MEHSECKREKCETQHLLLSVFEAEKPAVVLIYIFIWRFSSKVMETFHIMFHCILKCREASVWAELSSFIFLYIAINQKCDFINL